MPDPIARRSDLLETASADDAIGLIVDDRCFRAQACVLVLFLDQEPAVLAVFAAATAHQVPSALQLFAVEFELQVALMNRNLDPSAETVFLMPSQEYIYLTSTIIKEVARFGGALGDLLHPDVARHVIAKFKSSSS